MIIRDKIRCVIDAASLLYVNYMEEEFCASRKREAQHSEHQLFREAIIEHAFAYMHLHLHLNPMMEWFYEEFMRTESRTLRVLHVLSVLYVKSEENAKLRLEFIYYNFDYCYFYITKFIQFYLENKYK